MMMERLHWLSLQEEGGGGRKHRNLPSLKQLWGHKHESTHDTVIKYKAHAGPESLMLLCLFFLPVQGLEEPLTTGCLSDMKRPKSAERTLFPLPGTSPRFCVSSPFTPLFNPFLSSRHRSPWRSLVSSRCSGSLCFTQQREKNIPCL